MNLRLLTKTIIVGLVALTLSFVGCNNQPQTHASKIDNLKKQLLADAQTLHRIETNDFVSVERDFRLCDSMLQYQSAELVEQSFDKLQLVQAYIQQFKVNQPVMHAEIDSTLLQLDRLKADAEVHYPSDSLVAVYIESETEYVNKLSNQIHYFEDRFGTCQQDLNTLKKQQRASR